MRGPYSTPITPLTGSLFHADPHALREARIPHEVALALGGWSSGNGNDGGEVAAQYGRGYRAETLLTAIKKVSYPQLDLSHLKVAIELKT